MTNQPTRKIDDSEFIQSTKLALEGHQDEPISNDFPDAGKLKATREQIQVRADIEETFQPLVNSGALILQTLAGSPGTDVLFILQIKVKGISHITTGNSAQFAQSFMVLVNAHRSNEAAKAGLQWLMDLTPIWHPQVSQYGLVRLPKKAASWEELVSNLCDLSLYRFYDLEQNVLNQPAATWAADHRELFPLG